jgi:hypothetical protein
VTRDSYTAWDGKFRVRCNTAFRLFSTLCASPTYLPAPELRVLFHFLCPTPGFFPFHFSHRTQFPLFPPVLLETRAGQLRILRTKCTHGSLEVYRALAASNSHSLHRLDVRRSRPEYSIHNNTKTKVVLDGPWPRMPRRAQDLAEACQRQRLLHFVGMSLWRLTKPRSLVT